VVVAECTGSCLITLFKVHALSPIGFFSWLDVTGVYGLPLVALPTLCLALVYT
jgi:hypothetical protein